MSTKNKNQLTKARNSRMTVGVQLKPAVLRGRAAHIQLSNGINTAGCNGHEDCMCPAGYHITCQFMGNNTGWAGQPSICPDNHMPQCVSCNPSSRYW